MHWETGEVWPTTLNTAANHKTSIDHWRQDMVKSNEESQTPLIHILFPADTNAVWCVKITGLARRTRADRNSQMAS